MTSKRSFLHLVSITYGVMIMLLIIVCLIKELDTLKEILDTFNDIMIPTTITFSATIVLPALEDKSNTPKYGVFLLLSIIGCALMYIADFSIEAIFYSFAEIVVTIITIWISGLVYFEMKSGKISEDYESNLSGKDDDK